jgi:hypothetical protein
MSEDLVHLTTLTDQEELNIIEGLLRANGIETLHDHEYAHTAGFADTVGIRMMVRAEDAESARAIITEAQRHGSE